MCRVNRCKDSYRHTAVQNDNYIKEKQHRNSSHKIFQFNFCFSVRENVTTQRPITTLGQVRRNEHQKSPTQH
jgi:hypothetical protein